mmetsp:Transcript_23695/g.70362  ORF Transcript_23695/g.70362 Transcript_23695/m.70362 type:complete len:279 (-) Transcript_23695:355-1191(-)
MRALVPHHRDALVAAPPGSPLVARRPLRPRAVVRRQPVVLAVRVVGEGLLLARAEHVEASEDNEDGAEVERHQVGRVALLLVEHDVARDGARDDHEALEDGDHVQRLEGAQPDREQVERAAGECERDGDEEVRVGRQEGVLLAPSRGGRLGVAPVEGDALDHLDARLRERCGVRERRLALRRAARGLGRSPLSSSCCLRGGLRAPRRRSLSKSGTRAGGSRGRRRRRRRSRRSRAARAGARRARDTRRRSARARGGSRRSPSRRCRGRPAACRACERA